MNVEQIFNTTRINPGKRDFLSLRSRKYSEFQKIHCKESLFILLKQCKLAVSTEIHYQEKGQQIEAFI